MTKIKIILALATSMSILALAACSSETKNTEIATMKGGTITALDFYDNARTQQSSQQIVFDMILSKVFTKHYGEDITDKESEEANKLMRDRLSFDKGLRSHVELTDADLKAAWEAFHPEVEAQIILVTSEEEATDLLKQVNEKDANFGEIAKENSLDASSAEEGAVTFSSATDTTTIPAEVKQAAFALKDGEISEIIPVQSAYGTPTYYIVKMVKNTPKGNDMSKFEDEVKEAATNAKLADQTFINQVIGEELIKANVKIKDDAFATILTTFIDAATPTEETEATDDSTDTQATEDKETETSESVTTETESK